MLEKLRTNWRFLCIAPLLFTSIETAFIRFNNISFFSPEALIAYLLLTILGVGYGFLLALGSRGLVAFLSSSLMVLLLFSQLKASLDRHYMYGIGLILIPFFYIIRAHIDKLLLIIFGVFFLGSLFTPPKKSLTTSTYPTPPTSSELPPFIEIILDEHLGIEGISDMNEGQDVAQEITKSLIHKGFRVYSKAYSRESQTLTSFSSFLNYTPLMDNQYFIENNPEGGFHLTRNEHFETLSEKGYLINVFQSKYLNFCRLTNKSIALRTCDTYDYTASSPFSDHSFSKAIHIMDNSFLFLSQINYVGLLRDRYFKPFDFSEGPNFPAIATFDIFPKILERLKNPQKGNVYFIHLLFPHGPYIFDEKCHFTQRSSNPQGYILQIQCAQHLIDRILTQLTLTEEGRNSIIIIHGDHGGKIKFPKLENLNSFNAKNILHTYNTLFVVKAPGFKPGLDKRAFPIDYLLSSITYKKNNLSYNEKKQFVHLRTILTTPSNIYDFGCLPAKIFFDPANKSTNLAVDWKGMHKGNSNQIVQK